MLLPLFFAAASVGALHLGLYEIHVGLVVFVSGCIGMFLGFAFWIVDMVRRADAERRAADRAQTELAIQDHRLRAETAAAVAAREGERHTRELLTILSHAPVMARGLDGRVRFWSAGAERLYGWTAEQATGALARTLLPTAFPTLEREAEAALLEHGEWHAELSRRARDGTVVQVASHWILHRDEIGRPDAVIEVDKDVTEQLRAQDAFQRGEARYRALVAATARVVWTTSADGKRSIELGQWLAFTGQTALEADWGGWLRAIHPDDQAEATRIWEEAVRERQADADGAPAPAPGRRIPPHGGSSGAGARRTGRRAGVGRRACRHHRPGEGAGAAGRRRRSSRRSARWPAAWPTR